MEQYNVTGMSCAACSARVEKAVSAVPGVTSCSVSLLTNAMGVEGTASAKDIIAAVEKAGYGASVKGRGGQDAQPSPAEAEEALRDFDAMREREGEKLCTDVLSKLETISSLVAVVEEESPRTVEAYRNRLREKISEVLSSAGVDENRILAEAAIYADRVAVDEETVRLRSHMSQLRSMLAGGSPIGRKIDFLIQEFNREANTIGSKCQNSDIAHVVVELKSEIEKIREQIQNIE